MGSKYTKAQKSATTKYIAEKTDEIKIRVPKGKRAEYQEFAKSQGKSMNKLVQELLDNAIKKSEQNSFHIDKFD